MQLYEYAVIRFVPQVEREEFFNIGVLVFCKRSKYIKVKFFVDPNKFQLFKTEVDYHNLLEYVDAFENIVAGNASGGPIATMDVAERFRWLTAVRSSCIQTSRPHPGRTLDLELLLDKLFMETVL